MKSIRGVVFLTVVFSIFGSCLVSGRIAHAAERAGGVSLAAGDEQVTISFTEPSFAPGRTNSDGFTLLIYKINVYQSDTLRGSVLCANGSTSNESCVVTTYETSTGNAVLENGTSYAFEVVALWKRNSDSTEVEGAASQRTEEIAPFTTPNIPSAPTATVDSSTATSVDVSWVAPLNNGESIDLYTVEVWNKEGTAKVSTISGCTTSTLTCEISGLSYGTSYSFKVSATNAAGPSDFSSISNTVLIVPNQPTGLQLARINSPSQLIRASWNVPVNNVEPISSYVVTFSPTTGDAIEKSTADNSLELDFTVGDSESNSDLEIGIEYSVTVAAVNDGGDGVVSQISRITPSTSPGSPMGVTSTISGTDATVAWTAPSSNGGESISEYTAQAFANDATDTTTPLTGVSCISTLRFSCTISGLTEGARYKFAVRARNQNNDYGAWSALSAVSDVVPIAVVPPPPPPPPPTPMPEVVPTPSPPPPPVVGSSTPSGATPIATTPEVAPSPYIGSLVNVRKKPPSKSLTNLNIATADTRVQLIFDVPRSRSPKTQVTRYVVVLTPKKGRAVTKSLRASAGKTINTTMKVKKGTTYSSTITTTFKDGKRSIWKGPVIVVSK